MKSIALAAAVMAGCVNPVGPTSGSDMSSDKVSYLCVGMENSERFGSCAGCGIDARRITSLIKTYYGYRGETLVSEQATKAEVVSKLKSGIERTPEDGLFLFFYSGHGGQEALGGKEPDWADRMDEFLCLYDTYMLDDEIWDIVSKCKGRVFLYFDACHSATMYRSVKVEISEKKIGKKGKKKARALESDPSEIKKTSGFTFRPERFVSASALWSGEGAAKASPRILCWSGCKESEYSYGGSNGGILTTAVVNGWSDGISYEALWSKATDRVKSQEPTQNPVKTYVGDFMEGLEAFK